MSPLAENNGGKGALTEFVKNTNAGFERRETHQMFSGVLSCTDTKIQSYTTAYNPEMAVCFLKQLKELFTDYKLLFNFVF